MTLTDIFFVSLFFCNAGFPGRGQAEQAPRPTREGRTLPHETGCHLCRKFIFIFIPTYVNTPYTHTIQLGNQLLCILYRYEFCGIYDSDSSSFVITYVSIQINCVSNIPQCALL